MFRYAINSALDLSFVLMFLPVLLLLTLWDNSLFYFRDSIHGVRLRVNGSYSIDIPSAYYRQLCIHVFMDENNPLVGASD